MRKSNWTGARWIHEIKFDGYRVQVHLANEAVRVADDDHATKRRTKHG